MSECDIVECDEVFEELFDDPMDIPELSVVDLENGFHIDDELSPYISYPENYNAI